MSHSKIPGWPNQTDRVVRRKPFTAPEIRNNVGPMTSSRRPFLAGNQSPPIIEVHGAFFYPGFYRTFQRSAKAAAPRLPSITPPAGDGMPWTQGCITPKQLDTGIHVSHWEIHRESWPIRQESFGRFIKNLGHGLGNHKGPSKVGPELRSS